MKRAAFLLLLVFVVVAAACGSKSGSTPTTPSAQTVPTGSASIDLYDTTPAGVTVTSGAGVSRPIVGVVDKLDGACPARSFRLAGITVLVTDKTNYESGSCADLVDGIRVGAIGTKKDDHTIEATRVKIAPALPVPPPAVAGEVASLSGTCPALTFALGNVTVKTTDATDYDGGTCADVKNGVRLAAAGRRGADRVLTAEHIQMPPPLEVVHGIVSALGGTCPRVTFALLVPGSRQGTVVGTNDRTRFEGAACSDLRDGLHAAAVGPMRPNGSIEARGVKIAPPQ